jgi:hypothetical protein
MVQLKDIVLRVRQQLMQFVHKAGCERITGTIRLYIRKIEGVRNNTH